MWLQHLTTTLSGKRNLKGDIGSPGVILGKQIFPSQMPELFHGNLSFCRGPWGCHYTHSDVVF